MFFFFAFVYPVSPYLNHFIQPDTIIPDSTKTQGWNRYSYVKNNPVNFIDPTGHDDIPWLEGLKYVIGQFISNGKIDDADWRDAARIYMPATHAGSNFSVVASAGPAPGGGGVLEANFVTTKNGEAQLFLTHGEGLSTKGASIGYAMGVVEGKFKSTSDFTGNFAQTSIGYNSNYLVGGSVDAWGGLTGGKPSYNGVWGYDFAVTVGTPGPSGMIVYGEAFTAENAVKGILSKLNIADTKVGKSYIDYAEKVSHVQLNGVGLFACRAAKQCGGSWAQ